MRSLISSEKADRTHVGFQKQFISPELKEQPQTEQKTQTGQKSNTQKPRLVVERAAYPRPFGKYILHNLENEDALYLSHHASLSRDRNPDLLLHVLKPSLVRLPGFLANYLDALKKARTLHHPQIIRPLEFGEVDRLYYVIEPLTNTAPLESIMLKCKEMSVTIPTPILLYLSDEILKLLEFAQTSVPEKPVFHLDLSPKHIFVDPETGNIQINRFQVRAALDELMSRIPGQITPDFAHKLPREIPISGKHDLHALGVFLYQALIGSPPFSSQDERTRNRDFEKCRFRPMEGQLWGQTATWLQFIEKLLRAEWIQSSESISITQKRKELLSTVMQSPSLHIATANECRQWLRQLSSVSPSSEINNDALLRSRQDEKRNEIQSPNIELATQNIGLSSDIFVTGPLAMEIQVQHVQKNLFAIFSDTADPQKENIQKISGLQDLSQIRSRKMSLTNMRITTDPSNPSLSLPFSKWLELCHLDTYQNPALPIEKASVLFKDEHRLHFRALNILVQSILDLKSGVAVWISSSEKQILRRELHLSAGRITYVYSNASNSLFLKHAIKLGLTDPENFMAEFADVNAHRIPYFEYISEQKSLPTYKFWDPHQQERLAEIMTWRAGQFAFDEGRRPYSYRPLSGHPLDLLYRSFQAQWTVPMLKQELMVHEHTRYHLSGIFPKILKAISWPKPIRSALLYFDGTEATGNIIRRSQGLEREISIAILFLIHTSGLTTRQEHRPKDST